jgi:hypothetical protein
MRLLLLLGLAVFFVFTNAFAQDTSSLNNFSTEKYINAIATKSARVSADIDKQSEKYLDKLEKQEQRLYKKLHKIDSVFAENIFRTSQQRYQQIRDQIKNRSQRLLRGNGQYTAWIDTSICSLKFLEAKQLSDKIPISPASLKKALDNVHQLQDQLKQAENIKEFISQRKQYLAQHLKDFKLGKDLQKYNKQAYYYTQQINEYKTILNDPDKIESKAISLLRKIPAFEKFMKENGLLAGLFDIPKNYVTSMTGLQTITQVRAILQDRISSIGPNGSQTVQQNIGSVQASLSQMRDRLSRGGSTSDMPDFKPNAQKTKTFLKRLEFGTNLQSTKSNWMFPMTTDVGLSVGYRLNDKSVVGIGGSYKLGLGKNWNNVEVSHQGIGFRTFVDYKIKGSFWLTGGGELNYRSQFSDFSIFDNYSPWQKSALLGLSKKYSIGKRFKGNLQLMYDFLHGSQIPKRQPVIFRVGYNF